MNSQEVRRIQLTNSRENMQEFKIADQTYTSRLLIGTAGYPNFHIMTESIAASGAEIATVSMRRVKLRRHRVKICSLFSVNGI